MDSAPAPSYTTRDEEQRRARLIPQPSSEAECRLYWSEQFITATKRLDAARKALTRARQLEADEPARLRESRDQRRWTADAPHPSARRLSLELNVAMLETNVALCREFARGVDLAEAS